MRKLTKIKNLSLSEFRILRLKFLDDLFYITADVENPDDLFLIRILSEAQKLDNLINKSSLSGQISTVKIEINNQPEEAIRKKAVFITALKETRGNVKESLKRARLDKLTALHLAANDSAFRNAWETASNQKVF